MMMRIAILAGALLVGLTACGEKSEDPEIGTASYSARQYMQAINDVARMDDRQYDGKRKPGELLAFAQIDKGEVVGDYIMGGGYLTRLLATAVGASGKVYAFQPEEFIAFRPQYAEEQDAAVAPFSDAEGNPVTVFPLRGPLAEPGWPEPLDTIITVMNFHDLYLSDFPEDTADSAVQMLYDSLKPGGTLVVVDHMAPDGSGAEAANTLHRMDAQLALNALTGAGFQLDGESDLYFNPDDPRTANVFDDSIRGQTDQFSWRLRKPQ
jgi:predicted methyltransferase